MTSCHSLEGYFAPFRENIIGRVQGFDSPFGPKEILYADWTASGRAYGPIEDCLRHQIMPFLANTHTGTTFTGTLMSDAYEGAKRIIKAHVRANAEDVLLFCGSGMTAAVTTLQRLLGLRLPERVLDYVQPRGTKSGTATQLTDYLPIDEASRPVVFVTHMEHHSNHITWLETIATVELIPPDEQGYVDLAALRTLLAHYRHRKYKIAAVTACSNVTGIQTPYHTIAKLIHEQGGLCFVDFAASAPYVAMDMHPAEPGTHLDAIYFSPHKFLGGPGSAGVLIFNRQLYRNPVPDRPGGGTVRYTNPWHDRDYVADIEEREDGGTPPVLQGIRAALCIRLKEAMGVTNIRRRKDELLPAVFDRLANRPDIELLAGHCRERLSIVSFAVRGAHYNLIVKLLNDRFGIQTRGGCSCAGPYGHFLLGLNKNHSYGIRRLIDRSNLSAKPGWIRLSIHPTITDAEVEFILDAIDQTIARYPAWQRDYTYDATRNEYFFKAGEPRQSRPVDDWFTASRWAESAPLNMDF